MNSNKIYITKKGTELPLLNFKGKDYLEVKYRIVWFREEFPTWSIETELKHVTETSALAKATIKDDQGRIVSTSHKFETVKGFFDFMEKAETGSIGRALALIGFGTQFCGDELDEGDRIVDSPVEPKSEIKSTTPNVTSYTSKPRENNQTLTLVQAVVDFKQRHLAREAGFKFDPIRKQWLKELRESEFETLPFDVKEVL